MWSIETSVGFETDKIKYLITPHTMGQGLDLGCGPKRLWNATIGVDRWVSAEGGSVVADLSDISMFADRSMDYVYSSHALEDFTERESVPLLREWWRVIKPNGHLVLYLPHEDLYPKVGEPGANPAHQQNLTPDKVIAYMREAGKTGWDLIENETRGGGNEYSFLLVFRKRMDGKKNTTIARSDKKKCLVVRYGGIGDMAQASSILPQLKEQGYEVWVNTTPNGHEILKADPHIDDFWLQEKDQVPNEELKWYWLALGERFEKVINLSESVECSLLVLAGRPESNWPIEKIRERMNVNYLERVHEIAGLPYKPAPRFYPTGAEKKWARKQREEIGGDFVILWSLSGSSIHKAWPHVEQCWARLLVRYRDIRIVTVGDCACEIFEVMWRKEPRFIGRSGKWEIRQSLTFAEEADLVIGPETGLLNAVGHRPVPKILMLSHSTVENLSRDWVNTTNLTPPASVDCYPCHRLHYGAAYCRLEEESHAAMCQWEISVDDVERAIDRVIRGRKAA